MGTLFHQPERPYFDVRSEKLDDFLAEAKILARKHGITVGDVIEAKKALEMERRNDLYVKNGDAFDEQIAGIGELLGEFVHNPRSQPLH